MAGEINDSNHWSSLGADLDTPNHNPTAYDSSFVGSWDSSSSSSLFSAPLKSELDSNEINAEDEFILELTRQMEDYMLQEDDDNESPAQCFASYYNPIPNVKNQNQQQRWKTPESTQQMFSRGSVGYRQLTSSGSGMRAVFLNRSGSKIGYNGTGVFLPPANGSTSRRRKIPGWSAALVPTRVLEALEQHFNSLKSLQTERIKKGVCVGLKPDWTGVVKLKK
ncbi:hypothetical protein R6Q57_004668 [Mikania cordata]